MPILLILRRDYVKSKKHFCQDWYSIISTTSSWLAKSTYIECPGPGLEPQRYSLWFLRLTAKNYIYLW